MMPTKGVIAHRHTVSTCRITQFVVPFKCVTTNLSANEITSTIHRGFKGQAHPKVWW